MEHHWKLINSGQVRISNTPQELWEAACSYFEWCDKNPIVTKETLKSGKEAGKVVTNERVRPYSIKAFCLHCGITEEYLRDLRSNSDQSNMYYQVASRILYIIYTQNFEMALVGEYSPVLMARVLDIGTDDTVAQPITVNVVTGLPNLLNQENDILKELEQKVEDIKSSTEQSEKL